MAKVVALWTMLLLGTSAGCMAFYFFATLWLGEVLFDVGLKSHPDDFTHGYVLMERMMRLAAIVMWSSILFFVGKRIRFVQ